MRKSFNEDGIAGGFEELPALLVVLVAVALFSVSVAHAVSELGDADDLSGLRDDCQAFTGMVRNSDVLCMPGDAGIYDLGKLRNISAADFAEEFNSTLMGFDYRVVVTCVDPGTGNITLCAIAGTTVLPAGVEFASAHTTVGVSDGGRIVGARVSVTVWRPGA